MRIDNFSKLDDTVLLNHFFHRCAPEEITIDGPTCENISCVTMFKLFNSNIGNRNRTKFKIVSLRLKLCSLESCAMLSVNKNFSAQEIKVKDFQREISVDLHFRASCKCSEEINWRKWVIIDQIMKFNRDSVDFSRKQKQIELEQRSLIKLNCKPRGQVRWIEKTCCENKSNRKRAKRNVEKEQRNVDCLWKSRVIARERFSFESSKSK